jgi:hypothetical protein
MTVIFLTPLLLSSFAAGYMAFVSQAHVFWRVTVVILVVIAAVSQAIDVTYPGVYVHFLIPLFIQIIVSIGVYIWSSLEQEDSFL